MRFTIWQLFVAISLVGVSLGFAVNYGTEPAIILSFILALAWISVTWAIGSWRKGVSLWRDLSTTTAFVTCFWMFTFVVNVLCDPRYVQSQNLRSLKHNLSHDARFRFVSVSVNTQAGSNSDVLVLRGNVRNEDDYRSLETIIRKRRSLGINLYDWKIMVEE